ncbi:MAG: CDP-diacylglycerol--serine O-phosphatidyltransferase [Flavobacteriales bacterium]|jgi:CDP-diacylglycerol--serine O-phosphatidyltransferase|tara:strand:- start:7350 stop:8036 length:687 start_codon:yes stop_codon:yes gene_type:complete
MRKLIPNLLTISNLICGCIALYFTFHNNLVFAAYLIGLSALFDFMDGAVARLLKVSGPMGRELDSLADMVSFGVVPGSVVFHLLEASSMSSYSFVALLIPALSAYRLAKFNIDERQTDGFIGLNTPANTLFFISFPLISHFQADHFLNSWIAIPELLILLTVLMSIAMVSEIPLFAFKFKNLKFADNKLRFSFIGLTVVLLGLLQFAAIPLLVLLYLLLSIVNQYATK